MELKDKTTVWEWETWKECYSKRWRVVKKEEKVALLLINPEFLTKHWLI